MKKAMLFFVFAILAFSLVSLAYAQDENESSDSSDENETSADSEDNETASLDNETESESESDDEEYSALKDNRVYLVDRKPLPNVAAIYCENMGYISAKRKDSTGKFYGVCVFPDGRECRELEFMREKCGNEYVVNGTGKKNPRKAILEKIKSGECEDEDDCTIRVQDSEIKIKELSGKRREIIAEKINAKTGLNLSAEDIDGETMLRVYLSNGRWANVKYMPDSASEKALERLKAKCEERECSLELKEVGEGNKTKIAYVLETEKESRLFFLFKKNMALTAEVDAETGSIISVKRPWWAFLAKEKDEYSNKEEKAEVKSALKIASNISA